MSRRTSTPRPSADAEIAAVRALPSVPLDRDVVHRLGVHFAAFAAVRECPELLTAIAAAAALPPFESRAATDRLVLAATDLSQRSVRAHAGH